MPQQAGGPKRLLECLSESDGFVRLVETRSRPQRCDYIALSYCWGDGTAVKKTTEETLHHHERGIPDESLPPLYREAVALARGLNIAYLWIDALCIIQDSPEDKEEELMQMGNIFSGAFVVVVAASASSPLNSLLRVKPLSGQSNTWRTALNSLLRVTPQSDRSHTRRSASLRGCAMNLDVKFRKRAESAHQSTDATNETPTAARAWCFQERLLASRCLVFCDDEVVWECRSCCQCECGGQKGSASEPKSSVGMTRYQQMLLPFAEHDPFQIDGNLKYFAATEEAYSFWETAVENYSARALTFKTDRLPAISAVASIVAKATGDRYLAGLWRDNLLAGLGWAANTDRKHRNPRPYQEYVAPTWSWASLPGGVHYPWSRRIRDPDFDALVLDACTGLEGQDPYGRVSDAAIMLSGFHCNANLKISKDSFRGRFNFGRRDVQKVTLGPCYAKGFQGLDFMLVEPDTSVDGLGGNHPYLRRITHRQTDRQRPCSGTVHLLWLDEDTSLILTPSRRRKGAYERLGIVGVKGPKIPKRAQRSSVILV